MKERERERERERGGDEGWGRGCGGWGWGGVGEGWGLGRERKKEILTIQKKKERGGRRDTDTNKQKNGDKTTDEHKHISKEHYYVNMADTPAQVHCQIVTIKPLRRQLLSSKHKTEIDDALAQRTCNTQTWYAYPGVKLTRILRLFQC